MDNFQILWHKFADTHPVDAAQILDSFLPEKVSALLEAAPPPIAAKVLCHISAQFTAQCLGQMPGDSVREILEAMDLELVALILRGIEKSAADELMENLSLEKADHLRQILQFPAGTAGAIMNSRVLAVSSDLTVGEALECIRRGGDDSPYLYVTDREHVLLGYAPISQLLRCAHDEPLSAIYSSDLPALGVGSDMMTVLAHLGWRRHPSLPVVNEKRMFLGVISYETLRRIEAELAERNKEPSVISAGRELGELYLSGLSRVLTEVASAQAFVQSQSKTIKEPPHDDK